MDLNKFLKDIERELELDILKKGETPILDRLQTHLDNLDGDFNLATMLNPKNLKVELYLSLLYRIINPEIIDKTHKVIPYNPNDSFKTFFPKHLSNIYPKKRDSIFNQLVKYFNINNIDIKLEKIRLGTSNRFVKVVNQDIYFVPLLKSSGAKSIFQNEMVKSWEVVINIIKNNPNKQLKFILCNQKEINLKEQVNLSQQFNNRKIKWPSPNFWKGENFEIVELENFIKNY